jgi:hypothetical protein
VSIRTISPRTIRTQDIRPAAPEAERALAFTGLFTRVAEKVDRSPQHVLEVAKGRRQSKHVLDAIVAEVRRIDATTSRRRERAA